MMSTNALTILYDADCSLCQGSKARLEAIDKTRQFQWLPLQDPSVAQQFPDILPWQLRVSMHVIDEQGRIYKGARAFREIGRYVSVTSVLGILLKLTFYLGYLPGFLFVADVIYGLIARYRYRLS